MDSEKLLGHPAAKALEALGSNEADTRARIDDLLSKRYLGADAAKAAGVKSSTLARWVDRGLVIPSSPSAGGSGTRHEYTLLDIVRIALMKNLGKLGFSWGRASLLAFELIPGFTRTLDYALVHCLATWICWKAGGLPKMVAHVSPEDAEKFKNRSSPYPAYFVFHGDGWFYAETPEDFHKLYSALDDQEGAVLINLMAIVYKAVCVLGVD
jgi:hypothetical protein